MNDKTYSAMKGIRRSDLWWMKKSPAHFKYHCEHPEESASLAFGSAAHAWVLEPDYFMNEYAVVPQVDRRTKEQTWIDAADFETIKDMYEALMLNEDISKILTAEKRVEVPFFWVDEETGEECKCKADIITEIDGVPYIIDYKTTTSCEDGAFERSARKYGYRFQAGFYSEGINMCTMEDHVFAFIAQEKTAPYMARLFICDEGFVNAGKREFHELLRKYHQCKETNEWKGYETEYLYAEEYE